MAPLEGTVRYYEIVELDHEFRKLLYENDAYNEKFHPQKGKIDVLNQPRVDAARSVSETSSTGRHHFRLPKLELVKYRGEISQWIGFWVEEGVALANASPNTPRLRPNENTRMFPNKTDHLVISSDLSTINPDKQCPFCTGYHSSSVCRKALTMSHYEKRNAFYSDDTPFLPTSESVLLTINHCIAAGASNEVYFQTFVAILNNGDIHKKIQVWIDIGPHRSYILGSLAGKMKYVQIGEEHLIHSLFGGYCMGLLKHSGYKAILRGLNSNLASKFSVLDQTAIGSAIPLAIPSVIVQNDLKNIGYPPH
ncbi:hypothetical protein PR048_015557 [Dryococelus australis]|uniref:Uncharacterized protein n=1 Tax=Dryococelus australis TaxID=614101 RepID=A0ABQ9HIB3_9NEOP|nr:hypothetical protein PR048_015557 [Dryococelus australis]